MKRIRIVIDKVDAVNLAEFGIDAFYDVSLSRIIVYTDSQNPLFDIGITFFKIDSEVEVIKHDMGGVIIYGPVKKGTDNLQDPI